MSLPTLYLNYHEIRAEPWNYLYSLQAEDFDAHLDALAAPPPESRVRLAITFDDGHHTQYENAFPALERHNLKAIFFVTAGFTGTQADYMSPAQLRQLAEAGHDVQAHGWQHRFLTHCTDAELDEELRRPKQTLEDHLGRAVDALSFPGGRWDARVLAACCRAGYHRAYTSEPWPPEWKQGGLHLFGRFGVQRGLSPDALFHLMRTGGKPSTPARLAHAAKLGLRRLIGDQRYHKLWCLLAHGDPGAEQNTGSR